MSDVTEALEEQLFQLLNGADDLTEIATGGIWWSQAPDTAGYPGVILELLDGDEAPGRVLNDGLWQVVYGYTVSCYAEGDNARALALQMQAAVYEALTNWAGGDGVVVHSSKRVTIGRPRPILDEGKTIIGISSDYEIKVRV